MTYYLHIQNENIISKGQVKLLNENVLNMEVDKNIYNSYEKYIYLNGEIILDPDYEEKQAQKERERIAKLKLTRGDVFRALLMAKQVTRSQIRQQLEVLPETTPEEMVTKEMALIDFDEALDFYRGNELIDTVGIALGITEKQLDNFFDKGNNEETKSDAWKELITPAKSQELEADNLRA